jgi:F-type H+-transporting ATPase subunit delta
MSRRIARPYAAALFEVVVKRQPEKLLSIQRELEAVAEIFERESRLVRVFEVPSVTPAQRRGVLEAVSSAAKLTPVTKRVLELLAGHARLRFLPEVAAAFRELVDRREGVVRGSVATPMSLSAEQLAALTQTLQARLGVRIELESEVRPELLAGFVARLGSRVFDGSLKTRLARFAAAAGRS